MLQRAPQSLMVRAMVDLPTPQELEILALKAGISMTEACRVARISPAVFHRWKRGMSSPTLESLGKLIATLSARQPTGSAK